VVLRQVRTRIYRLVDPIPRRKGPRAVVDMSLWVCIVDAFGLGGRRWVEDGRVRAHVRYRGCVRCSGRVPEEDVDRACGTGRGRNEGSQATTKGSPLLAHLTPFLSPCWSHLL
jgi:hypothetical protein